MNNLIKSLEHSVVIIKHIIESSNNINDINDEELKTLYYRLNLLKSDADILKEQINENKTEFNELSEQYVVIGGVYKDTSFTNIVGKLEKYGPFNTFKEAKQEWLARSFHDVDNCHSRYMIERVSKNV